MNHGVADWVAAKEATVKESFWLVSFTTQGEGEGRAEKWTGNSLALTSGSSQSSGERSVKHNKMGAIINQVQASQQGLEEAGLKYSWQESGTTKVKWVGR